MNLSNEPARLLFRHTLATVAYRAGKALRGAPESFGLFKACESARTPAQLVAHLADLYDWALSKARGAERWDAAPALAWETEVARFFASLKAFDDYLASGEPVHCEIEGLLQGPVADSLTHIGQIALLRRLAGCPIRGENYAKADISVGCVGLDQPPPRREFD
ncbi:MAG TPA: hypothetical protein VMT51_14705 [Dongiaceae bacterium]|nr:hypothetical protein [Dongiaceae bacterium]